MMGLVRRGRQNGPARGLIVTWDIDSRDASTVAKVRRFVFGYVIEKAGKRYTYAGFVHDPGVRYIAQSAVFAVPRTAKRLLKFLEQCGVDHEAIPARLD